MSQNAVTEALRSDPLDIEAARVERERAPRVARDGCTGDLHGDLRGAVREGDRVIANLDGEIGRERAKQLKRGAILVL